MHTGKHLRLFFLIGLALSILAVHASMFADHAVTAIVTTGTASGSFDDPAIWIHPTDPAASTVLGTNKDTGFYVYDLAGN